MKYAVVLLSFLCVACGQGKKYHDEKARKTVSVSQSVQDILNYQEERNEEFRNPETSPLPDRYRKNFEGLTFFAPDTNYIVVARFERTPNAVPFMMPTTTSRKTEEVLFGIATFSLNGAEHQLEVFQTLDLVNEEGYEDYLFLPFSDLTNGNQTYGGGRYLDLKIPDGDTLVIDFNRAYNPYCVYNKKYSCPLVPRQNFMNTKVVAGVQDFIPN